MSLLLDAQRKSQQANSANGTNTQTYGLELSLEDVHHNNVDANVDHAVEHARHAGQNLFDAKAHSPSHSRAGINRNLLIALAGTVILLGAGAGYVWYETSGTTAPRLVASLPASTPIQQTGQLVPELPPETAKTVAESEVALPPTVAPKANNVKRSAPPRRSARKRPATTVRIEQHGNPMDLILKDAYDAYQTGMDERAQTLYLQALKLDSRNIDTLLGLAAIAQRRGADSIAVQYYSQVLELDPRDPVANAGLSALTTGENSESRLKLLLIEQPDSSALHFALGNRYVEQGRWPEAQQSYFNAYKLSPNNAELAFNLAVSLDKLGQKAVAAQYYQRALDLDTGSVKHFDHGQISQRIEDLSH